MVNVKLKITYKVPRFLPLFSGLVWGFVVVGWLGFFGFVLVWLGWAFLCLCRCCRHFVFICCSYSFVLFCFSNCKEASEFHRL